MRELYDFPHRDSICRAFAFAAVQTWTDLRDYGELEEESITDYRILQLKRMCPHEVRIIKFSKPREARTGADWEWWFGAGKEWFGMRVQAKRLDIPKLQYSRLDHTIGKTGKLQVERLIADATERTLYPMYCFYNFWSEVNANPPWRCGTFAPQTELWGATVADAVVIREKVAQKARKLDDIGPTMMPLMCLACCRGHARTNRPTLPHRARGIAFVLTGDTDLVPELVPQPPWYVAHALNQQTSNLPTGVLNLDGILVVEENPNGYEGEAERIRR